MRVLNDHNGEMDGRVQLEYNDIYAICSALELYSDEYPQSARVWGIPTMLLKFHAIERDLQEKQIKREISRENNPKD
jgi:hypothetical protein